MLHAARIRAPADPLAIAARVAERPGLAVLASTEPGRAFGRYSYVGFDPVGSSGALDPLEGAPALERGALEHVPRFVGVLPYEAFRGLERARWTAEERRAEPLVRDVEWIELGATVVVDHERDEAYAVARSEAEALRIAALFEGAERSAVELSLEAEDAEPLALHHARIERAIELVVAGDLYQVNLARAIDLRVRGARDAAPDGQVYLELFARLSGAAPTPFGALLSLASGARVLSTSPELFLDAAPDASRTSFAELSTEPIKGTRPRAADPAVDRAQREELDRDPKERAELSMIVDVERNDLARVSMPGSVRVTGDPEVQSFRTVHHRVARVTSTVRPGLSRAEVLAALTPSGSVTGAPKVRAMEVIGALEPRRRGLYTGALGYLSHGGSLRLSMAIRCAVFDASGRGEYLVGGGVVADSDPSREVEETRWKASQISHVAARGAQAERALRRM